MIRFLDQSKGFTLIEAIVVVAIAVILAAVAIPTGLAHVEDHRLNGAARYLATLCAATRSQAVRRSAYVAIRFEPDPTAVDVGFRVYVDGNSNGVRTREIGAGVDPPLSPLERLPDRFPGIRFGIAPGVTGIDPGETLAPGDDPIRVGTANLVSFSPNGSVTSGTVYIRSDHGQRAIRLLGATGRTRLLSFSFPEGQWTDR